MREAMETVDSEASIVPSDSGAGSWSVEEKNTPSTTTSTMEDGHNLAPCAEDKAVPATVSHGMEPIRQSVSENGEGKHQSELEDNPKPVSAKYICGAWTQNEIERLTEIESALRKSPQAEQLSKDKFWAQVSLQLRDHGFVRTPEACRLRSSKNSRLSNAHEGHSAEKSCAQDEDSFSPGLAKNISASTPARTRDSMTRRQSTPGQQSKIIANNSTISTTKRFRFTQHQRDILDHEATYNESPNLETMTRLADEVGIGVDKVKTFFHNVRQGNYPKFRDSTKKPLAPQHASISGDGSTPSNNHKRTREDSPARSLMTSLTAEGPPSNKRGSVPHALENGAENINTRNIPRAANGMVKRKAPKRDPSLPPLQPLKPKESSRSGSSNLHPVRSDAESIQKSVAQRQIDSNPSLESSKSNRPGQSSNMPPKAAALDWSRTTHMKIAELADEIDFLTEKRAVACSHMWGGESEILALRDQVSILEARQKNLKKLTEERKGQIETLTKDIEHTKKKQKILQIALSEVGGI